LSKLRVSFEYLFAGPSVLVFGNQNMVTHTLSNFPIRNFSDTEANLITVTVQNLTS